MIRGNTLVIPIETSLLYVEPLYLSATDPPIPQIKRVDRLGRLEGGHGEHPGAGPARCSSPKRSGAVETGGAGGTGGARVRRRPPPSSAARANQLYEEAEAAQRAGDWATYGDKVRQLGEVLDQLAALNP